MKTYSKTYRIIHWSIAIAMLLLLITIFLRSTWLNKYNVAEILESFLNKEETVITHEQAIKLAKSIRKPMWNWHIYLGYLLTGLFAIRFALPVFGEMKFQNPLDKNTTPKDKFKAWTYIIFYICITASLVTGLLIVFGPKSIHHLMEEIHVLSIYYFIAYLVLHYAGVLLAEFKDEKGIISRIISGGKK
ncbi:cytochrome b/b6 domain-containing protein [Wenyingzhuangia aestuarii]|uniref:cytochrome b/b6 domain-containing protein n=1 Tax=Wenyingzhuangia aestuarii TaxID=1647582 RepID=UPI00143A847D|nr:cytochrome b/b6 domain-containing protein [Wenyingzhuangia aestuarii]NJB82524.1 cytochrome b561 [Wenyingzhuangia aestuarii]